MSGEAFIAFLAEYWLSILSVFCLLVLSAFFSGSETALTAASRSRMHTLENNGEERAGIVNRLIERRDRLIGTLLIGNNLVNILASSLTTSLLIGLFGDSGVAIATLAMTVLLVIFSEVLPKSWAIASPDRFALAVAPLVRPFVAIVGPVSSVVNGIVRRLLNIFGINLAADMSMLSAHEELRGPVDLLHREGSVIKADRDRLGGVLDLGELEISDIMIHRTSMRAINADEPPETCVRDILESPFTRLPLWRGNPENIVGVLHVKDLLRALHAVDGDASKVDIGALMTAPWFVPDTRPVSEQLKAFRRRKTPFALVVDEYGEVEGLVTLEDILEEIVGDITDEHDVAIPGVRRQPDGSVNVDGAVPIRDLNRVMDWNLPDEEATTIAGLVIHEARSIPEIGQSFTFHGFRFRVLRKARNRITALRIQPLPKPKAAE